MKIALIIVSILAVGLAVGLVVVGMKYRKATEAEKGKNAGSTGAGTTGAGVTSGGAAPSKNVGSNLPLAAYTAADAETAAIVTSAAKTVQRYSN